MHFVFLQEQSEYSLSVNSSDVWCPRSNLCCCRATINCYEKLRNEISDQTPGTLPPETHCLRVTSSDPDSLRIPKSGVYTCDIGLWRGDAANNRRPPVRGVTVAFDDSDFRGGTRHATASRSEMRVPCAPRRAARRPPTSNFSVFRRERWGSCLWTVELPKFAGNRDVRRASEARRRASRL